jgi:BlaI family penicillinase repressor
MKRRIPLPGGELEYAVLIAIWDLKTASGPVIHKRVGEPSGLVYTTVAKVLDRLHAKGLISREREGKTFMYRAKIVRAVVEKARVGAKLNELLGAAPHAAVATLVDAVESLDPKLLDELERAVAARRRAQNGS